MSVETKKLMRRRKRRKALKPKLKAKRARIAKILKSNVPGHRLARVSI